MLPDISKCIVTYITHFPMTNMARPSVRCSFLQGNTSVTQTHLYVVLPTGFITPSRRSVSKSNPLVFRVRPLQVMRHIRYNVMPHFTNFPASHLTNQNLSSYVQWTNFYPTFACPLCICLAYLGISIAHMNSTIHQLRKITPSLSRRFKHHENVRKSVVPVRRTFA